MTMLRTVAKLTNKRTERRVYSTSWSFARASRTLYILASLAKPLIHIRVKTDHSKQRDKMWHDHDPNTQ
jgi:hypothetical protein